MNSKSHLLTHDEKRSTKLTLKQVKKIQLEFPNYPNYKFFAEAYNVVQSTIRCWVDEDYRQKKYLDNYKRLKKNLEDEEFKKHHNMLLLQSRKYRIKKFKKIREHQTKIQRKYLQRPKVKQRVKKYLRQPKVKQKAREYYNRPEIKQRIKEYQQRPKVKQHILQYQKEYRQRPKMIQKRKEYDKKRQPRYNKQERNKIN